MYLIVFIASDEIGQTQFAPTLSRIIKRFKGSVTRQKCMRCLFTSPMCLFLRHVGRVVHLTACAANKITAATVRIHLRNRGILM